MTQTQLLALDQIAEAAVACEKATGCPAALSAAQAALESAWLSKMSGAHNCFGIKSTAVVVGRDLVPTHEWFTPAERDRFLAAAAGRTAVPAAPLQQRGSRTYYKVLDWFAAFSSLADCFTFHAGLLQCGVYRPAWTAYQTTRDIEQYVRGIAPHYATAPDYAESVLEIARGATLVQALTARA